MHPSVLIHTSGRDFDGFICDYVFMFFPPSFLRSWGGAVTRIRKSSQRRHCVLGAGCFAPSASTYDVRGRQGALRRQPTRAADLRRLGSAGR